MRENFQEQGPQVEATKEGKGLMKRLVKMPWVRRLVGAIGILSALEGAAQASAKEEAFEDWAETPRLGSLIDDAIGKEQANLRVPLEVEDEDGGRVVYTDGLLEGGKRVAAILVKDEGDPKRKGDETEIAGIFIGGDFEGVRYDREGKFAKLSERGDPNVNPFGQFSPKKVKAASLGLNAKAGAREISEKLDFEVNSLLRICAEEYELLQGLELAGQRDGEEAQSLRRHIKSILNHLKSAFPSLDFSLPEDLNPHDYLKDLGIGK